MGYQYEDLETLEGQTGLSRLSLDGSRLESVVYCQSHPTRFVQVYRDELGQAPNIRVYLHANALELVANESVSRVDLVRVTCLDGPRFSVNGKFIVLATGGMENARLLLLSDRRSPNGLGNDGGLVGRYFMDPVVLRPGVDISFTKPGVDLRLYHYFHRMAGGVVFAVMTATHELLRREEMANFRIHLVPSPVKYDVLLGSLFSRLDDYDGEGYLQKTSDNSISMHLVLEPNPNPDSRITLSSTRDLLGQRQVRVRWLLTPSELSNADRALELVAIEFGRMGSGRGHGAMFTDKSRWPGNLEAGNHHCGTTRMSDSPETGVVDADCRVFGIDNLYIAGSSVFPTIGYANPTLTIVALALRLSEHIKRLIQ